MSRAERTPERWDVIVIGAGPAGISACLELDRRAELKVLLLESGPLPGGMPRSCGPGFGLRDQRRFLSGPSYARRLTRLLDRTRTRLETETTVLELLPGREGEEHSLTAVSPRGAAFYRARFILLATGCFESSRESRLIPGSRPSGIMTTGTLQQLVNLQGIRPGRRAAVVGSEYVSLSSLLTLRRAGVEPAGLVEEEPTLNSHPLALLALRAVTDFPVLKGTRVKEILGRNRVQGLLLEREGRERRLGCDLVVMSGSFRPDSALLDSTPLHLDPASRGPMVDQNLVTSVPGILAAGNLLRGADPHGFCALEGRRAARAIIREVRSGPSRPLARVALRVEPPLRHVVPQWLYPDRPQDGSGSGFSFQVQRTLFNPVLEARSGDRLVWRARFARITGRTRRPLPVTAFDWAQVDPEEGITLRLAEGIDQR